MKARDITILPKVKTLDDLQFQVNNTLIRQIKDIDSAETFYTNTIKISGAELLRFYTYAHTITAAEDSANEANITITAVTLAKIRSINVVKLNAAGTVVIAMTLSSSFSGTTYLSSTTNLKIGLGSSAVENDVISATIIEAV